MVFRFWQGDKKKGGGIKDGPHLLGVGLCFVFCFFINKYGRGVVACSTAGAAMNSRVGPREVGETGGDNLSNEVFPFL